MHLLVKCCLFVRIIENKKIVLISGQVRLSKYCLPHRVGKGIRIGPRRVEAFAGAQNRKNSF